MRPYNHRFTLDNQSATKYAASQHPGAAGNLTLTASAASIDSSGMGRIIGIASSGADTGRTFTITGYDEDGVAVTENVTGPSSGTSVSTKFYTSITSIAVDAATAGNITVGNVNTTLTAVSKCIPVSVYDRIATMVEVNTSGTINYTVKETFGPLIDPSDQTSNTQNLVWYAPSALSSKTGNAFNLMDIGARAFKFYINSYTDGGYINVNVNIATNAPGQ